MKNILLLLLFFLPWTLIGQDPEPPLQPKRGPGGTDYPHASTKITQYGDNITNWYWLIEPTDPKPDSAEVVVFFHGTNSNTDSNLVLNGQELFCRHIAQKGYSVIYPLYQYGGQTLPFTQQLQNAAEVIKLALIRLEKDPTHSKPKRWKDGKIKWATTGISRGGGMSINTATHHDLLGLPSVDAIVAFVPGSGRRHRIIDPEAKVAIVSAEEDDTNGPLASHNAHQEAWDSLYRHPCENREYFIVHSDDHGSPNIVAKHDCHGSGNNPNNRFRLNALDFFGSWKWSAGTFNCTFRDSDCEYVFGKDSLAIYMGRWSDDRLVNPSTWVDPCTTTALKVEKQIEINLFPNPGNSEFYLSHSDDILGYSIYNVSGKKQANAQDAPPGLYHVRIKLSNGSILIKKWVKI